MSIPKCRIPQIIFNLTPNVKHSTFESMGNSTNKTKKKPAHGTYTRYKYHDCRCRRCKTAVAAYVKAYREKDSGDKLLTHGTRSAYNCGCRCEDCAFANREYAKLWKRKQAA